MTESSSLLQKILLKFYTVCVFLFFFLHCFKCIIGYDFAFKGFIFVPLFKFMLVFLQVFFTLL